MSSPSGLDASTDPKARPIDIAALIPPMADRLAFYLMIGECCVFTGWPDGAGFAARRADLGQSR
jgi:hypothetical protein